MTVHNVEKVTKNDLTIISYQHAHPHTMKKTHVMQSFKYSEQNCNRSCTHKILRVNADSWTDKLTDEWTGKQTEICMLKLPC